MNNAISETQAVLDSGFARLRFPQPLENTFRQAYETFAASSLRNNIKYILLVYILLGVGIATMVPTDNLDVWPYTHGILGILIAAAMGCSRLTALDRYQQIYTALIAGGGVMLTVVVPPFFTNPMMSQVAQLGTLYAVIVVYTAVGLRFRVAVVACLGAGVLGLAFIEVQGLELNWVMFHQAYTGGNILGMVLSYMAEHRSRTVFLQSRLLELEKINSEALANKMEQMSRQDALTGLANRRYFDDVFDREWKRASRYGTSISVMFIDVDHFKHYNDHYGHQQGDKCLQQVATLLGKQCNRAGDLAARFGGEEFVMIYPQTSVDGVIAIAKRTLQAIQAANIPHAKSATSDFVTVSIGIANCIPSSQITPDQLLRQADMALYQAKQKGRNQWQVACAAAEAAPKQTTL